MVNGIVYLVTLVKKSKKKFVHGLVLPYRWNKYIYNESYNITNIYIYMTLNQNSIAAVLIKHFKKKKKKNKELPHILLKKNFFFLYLDFFFFFIGIYILVYILSTVQSGCTAFFFFFILARGLWNFEAKVFFKKIVFTIQLSFFLKNGCVVTTGDSVFFSGRWLIR